MTQRKPLLLLMIIISCEIALGSTGFGETVTKWVSRHVIATG